MGVLDDAIREHLELKRRHGVPEEELQRQEEEALGPTRRDVAQQVEESDAAVPAEDEETALFDMDTGAAAPAGHDAEVVEPAESAPADAAPEAPVHDEPPAAMDPPPRAEPEAAAEATPVEPPPVEPPPASDELDAVDDALGDTAPHGFPPVAEEDEDELDDDLLAADAEDDDLDVLEDTPDFLQETPEHDRLWFEQKPPRDFDFD